MEKTIEQRAEEVARAEYGCDGCHFSQCVRHGGEESPWDVIECAIEIFESAYTQGATEQKAIDDEAYRKDMRYVGVKQEELIDKVVDEAMEFFNELESEYEDEYFFSSYPQYDHGEREKIKAQLLERIHEKLKLT